jgi:formylglycine-generating enzyme required for sulfatase activity
MKKFYSLFLVICLSSCAKNLSYGPAQHSKEVINGFDVEWTGNLKPDVKSHISNILESMVYVEGDCFVMGKNSERLSDAPAHYVRVSDFYICKMELTCDDYKRLMGTDTNYYSRYDWEKLINYINSLSGLEFDFPTEAQWEFAAKGGRLSQGYIYAGSNDINMVRCESITCSNKCIPNELGLLNMSGGVSEWCKDSYSEYDVMYSVDPCVKGRDYYVVRGGSYESYDIKSSFNDEVDLLWCEEDFRMCETTSRMRCENDNPSKTIGCRLVLNL